jgi:hypothetical protein
MHDAAGFFFTGAGTVPGFLVYAGDPGLAVITMVALMLAACLGGMADPQAPFRTVAARDDSRQGNP